jgi:intracellular sulfur oxidation DsrE/DsrF family protein
MVVGAGSKTLSSSLQQGTAFNNTLEMATTGTIAAVSFGKACSILDASDLEAAKSLGLLNEDVEVEVCEPDGPGYRVAYMNQANLAEESFENQQAGQSLCKRFAQKCGFQLSVKNSSTKPKKRKCQVRVQKAE